MLVRIETNDLITTIRCKRLECKNDSVILNKATFKENDYDSNTEVTIHSPSVIQIRKVTSIIIHDE